MPTSTLVRIPDCQTSHCFCTEQTQICFQLTLSWLRKAQTIVREFHASPRLKLPMVWIRMPTRQPYAGVGTCLSSGTDQKDTGSMYPQSPQGWPSLPLSRGDYKTSSRAHEHNAGCYRVKFDYWQTCYHLLQPYQVILQSICRFKFLTNEYSKKYECNKD